MTSKIIFLTTIFVALIPAGVLASDPDNFPDSGKPVVTQICGGCHATGIMGAPRIGDKEAWSHRFERDGGVDGLAEIAKHGKGNMPPRGGQPSLSDDQIKDAIAYMLKQSQVL